MFCNTLKRLKNTICKKNQLFTKKLLANVSSIMSGESEHNNIYELVRKNVGVKRCEMIFLIFLSLLTSKEMTSKVLIFWFHVDSFVANYFFTSRESANNVAASCSFVWTCFRFVLCSWKQLQPERTYFNSRSIQRPLDVSSIAL